MVVNFRKLNDLIMGDSFPLPNIIDILDQLGNAKYYTFLNLVSSYQQIPVITINVEQHFLHHTDMMNLIECRSD